MSTLELYVNNSRTPAVVMSDAHLPWHRPCKTGDHPWKIVCRETGEVVDSYAPPRSARATPCTPYAGSWADSMQRRSAGLPA